MFTILTYRRDVSRKPSLVFVPTDSHRDIDVGAMVKELIGGISEAWTVSGGDISMIYYDGELIGAIER